MPDAIELSDDKYDQLFEGHRPRATNQLAAVRSPFGRPQASGWTERPDRSSPSSLDGQDVRVRAPKKENQCSSSRRQWHSARRSITQADARRKWSFAEHAVFTDPALYVEPIEVYAWRVHDVHVFACETACVRKCKPVDDRTITIPQQARA